MDINIEESPQEDTKEGATVQGGASTEVLIHSYIKVTWTSQKPRQAS